MYNVCIMSVCIYIYLHTYITLHYITLHYVTLHYITLHYITLLTYIHTLHIYIYSWSTTQQHGKCHFYSFLSNTVDLSYLCNLQTWTNDPDPNRTGGHTMTASMAAMGWWAKLRQTVPRKLDLSCWHWLGSRYSNVAGKIHGNPL